MVQAMIPDWTTFWLAGAIAKARNAAVSAIEDNAATRRLLKLDMIIFPILMFPETNSGDAKLMNTPLHGPCQF